MKTRMALTLALLALLAPAARAGDDARGEASGELLRALQDEMARSMKLHLPEMSAPFYIGYAVTDLENENLLSEYGGVVEHSRWRSRSLDVDLRVGDRMLGSSSAQLASGSSLSLDDDYDVLRRQIWLATDGAYKLAASELEQKRAALTQNEEDKREVPEISTEKPLQKTVGDKAPGIELAGYIDTVRRMSGVLSEYPAIQEGVVEMTATRSRRMLVNSEGTVTSTPANLVRLEFKCRTQADDGMNLVNFASWVAPTLSELPPADELVARARQVADELVAMRTAPVVEDYTGPILFEGDAAAQLLAHLMVRNLSGTPPANDPRFPAFSGDDTLFASKLGKKVLPPQFTVVDDPTLAKWKDRALIGGYEIDDEGVPAQKVTLVEKGMLKGFLMSRTPRKEQLTSNGHGRAGFGGQPRGQVSNLIVTSTSGLADAALEGKLLARAKAEGEAFGIVVTRLDDYNITSGYREPGETMRPGGEGGVNLTPVVAYKVTRAGKRELLRGVDIESLRLRSLKDIIASSKDSRVYNSIQGGIAASIVSPNLLLEEADVKKRTGSNPKLPVLPTPLAAPAR